SGARATILRVPGIYAFDREGGDPRERVRRGAPTLADADDVFTNHIHADDLARACVAALARGPAMRAVNVCDDDASKTGAYLDRIADRCALPRVPRVTREQAQQHLSPLQMSFLGESRRLDNTRMKRELGLALRYPSVDSALDAACATAARHQAAAPSAGLTRPVSA
ncbi:MAG TPA: SDR family NAD(P)-dependent oxidoreductase, partial [Burkholderiaceae bacterium]|nr:SDR family NAD(P)-dependent oxidoreductase [Burkholderiaceae bacterium]